LSNLVGAVLGALVVVLMVGAGSAVLGTPPQLPELSEAAKALLERVKELDAKHDAEGLIGALEEAGKLPGMDRGRVTWPLIQALERVDVEKLRGEKAVQLLVEESKHYAVAVTLLAKIGTEPAWQAVEERAREDGNQMVRQGALRMLAKFKLREQFEFLLAVFADKKEVADIRAAVLDEFSKTVVTEEQYRRLFELAVKDPSDVRMHGAFRAATVMRRDPTGSSGRSVGGHPAAMEPLLAALEKLAGRIDELEGKEDQAKEREAAMLSYEGGFHVLQTCLPPLAKKVGCEVRFADPLVLSKDGKEVFSYDQDAATKDPAERKRVLGLWRKWWQENREAVVKALEKEPDAEKW